MVKKHVLAEAGSPSSKAAALLARGAYSQYVSTAKGRERRWQLFSTFPIEAWGNPILPVKLDGLRHHSRLAKVVKSAPIFFATSCESRILI